MSENANMNDKKAQEEHLPSEIIPEAEYPQSFWKYVEYFEKYILRRKVDDFWWKYLKAKYIPICLKYEQEQNRELTEEDKAELERARSLVRKDIKEFFRLSQFACPPIREKLNDNTYTDIYKKFKMSDIIPIPVERDDVKEAIKTAYNSLDRKNNFLERLQIIEEKKKNKTYTLDDSRVYDGRSGAFIGLKVKKSEDGSGSEITNEFVIIRDMDVFDEESTLWKLIYHPVDKNFPYEQRDEKVRATFGAENNNFFPVHGLIEMKLDRGETTDVYIIGAVSGSDVFYDTMTRNTQRAVFMFRNLQMAFKKAPDLFPKELKIRFELFFEKSNPREIYQMFMNDKLELEKKRKERIILDNDDNYLQKELEEKEEAGYRNKRYELERSFINSKREELIELSRAADRFLYADKTQAVLTLLDLFGMTDEEKEIYFERWTAKAMDKLNSMNFFDVAYKIFPPVLPEEELKKYRPEKDLQLNDQFRAFLWKTIYPISTRSDGEDRPVPQTVTKIRNKKYDDKSGICVIDACDMNKLKRINVIMAMEPGLSGDEVDKYLNEYSIISGDGNLYKHQAVNDGHRQETEIMVISEGLNIQYPEVMIPGIDKTVQKEEGRNGQKREIPVVNDILGSGQFLM
jgi:hypothetical protein